MCTVPAAQYRMTEITVGHTNKDGRIPDLLRKDAVLENGIYKLRF